MPLIITCTIMKNLKILTLFGSASVVFEFDFVESEFDFEGLSENWDGDALLITSA